MQVGHNKGVAVALCSASALALLLGFGTETFPSVVLGAALAMAGVLYAVNAAAVVSDGHLEVRNLLGFVVERYPFEHRTDLRVRDGRLYVRTAKGEVATRVGGFLVSSRDLAALGRWIQAASPHA